MYARPKQNAVRLREILETLVQIHVDCYEMDQGNPDVKNLRRLAGEAAITTGHLLRQQGGSDDDASL